MLSAQQPDETLSMNEELGVNELRRAVVNEPRNAELRYLLGAEMAQQKDYDGAVMEMSAAIALNPLLHIARFQLGLLHLTMARPDHAIAVLAPLENLDDHSALKHFKRGLESLIRDDFDHCMTHLRHGIELNHNNAPLNRDMTMLMGKVADAAAAATPIALTQRFFDDPIHQRQRQACVRRIGAQALAGRFAEICTDIAKFVVPPATTAAMGKQFVSNWPVGGPWRAA